MGVVGAAIKGFGKALKSRGRKPGVLDRTTGKPFPESIQLHIKSQARRHEKMKEAGYKKEPYADSGKRSKTGAHKLKEVWSYNPYKKAKPSKLKKFAKKVGKVVKEDVPFLGAGAAGGVTYGKLKKRFSEKRKGKK
jgi:hypothetical protein